MDILKDISEISDVRSSVLTIGTFDGLHLGHQCLIKKNVELSKEMNSKSVVITFTPNPYTVINNIPRSSHHIISKDEKYSLMNKLKVDILLEINFTDSVLNMTAEQFLKRYILAFNPTALVVGYDHHFGKDRLGNYDFLLNNCNKHDYKLISVEPFSVKDDLVSSSKIRKYLTKGFIKKVNSMLGRSYSVRGEVVPGDRVGRELSVPTANIDMDKIENMLPSCGVYCVDVIKGDEIYRGMCNIGYKPTVSKKLNMTFEVHLFNFNDFNLYGQFIDIEFVDYIRSERKFKNREDLKDQLLKDKVLCQSITN